MSARRTLRLRACTLGLVLAFCFSGCEGQARESAQEQTFPPAAPMTSAAAQGSDDSATAVSRLLRLLGASKVYVMAGDDRLRAGLGVIDADGLRPVDAEPAAPLVSNIAGNGRTVVLGGAGVTGHSYVDGVYRVRGRNLTTLAKPERGMYGPSVAPDGTLSAVQPDGGFSVRKQGGRAWHRDPRLAHTPLSTLAWGRHGNAYAVKHANTARARLIELTATGRVRSLRDSVACASLVLHAPTRDLLVGTLPLDEHPRTGICGRDRARLFRPSTGEGISLPAGWNPVAWSADSSALLLVRGNSAGVWERSTHKFIATADLGVEVWMAAPIYG